MAWAEILPSGRYRGRYRIGGKAHTLKDEQGKPQTFSQKAAAIRAAAVKENAGRQPGALDPGAGLITWGEWRKEWWPHHRQKVEANSAFNYDSKIKHYLAPRWDDETLVTIDRLAIQEWVTDMPSSDGKLAGASPAAGSVHVIYSLFSASMRAAVVAKKISATPCIEIELPVIPAPDIHCLTRKEFDHLLTFLQGSWRRLAVLCVGTGMRWGEAVALHWQDVHETTISIHQAFSSKGKYIKTHPKSKKPRTVPLPGWLAEELNDWQGEPVAHCETPHKLAGRCRSGLVVPNIDGKCLPYSTCFQEFQRAVALAKIGRTTIHDLRDTYASWLLQNGITIEQIAELLGHSDINLTRTRYAQFGSSQFDRVSAALAPILPQQLPDNVISMASRRRPGA